MKNASLWLLLVITTLLFIVTFILTQSVVRIEGKVDTIAKQLEIDYIIIEEEYE